MKMKIAIIVTMMILIGLTSIRLWSIYNEDQDDIKVVSTPVKVQKVHQEILVDSLKYQGRVAPTRVEMVSFKSGGRVASFEGEIGNVIPKGAELVALDPTDLESAYEGAKLQFTAAEAEFTRATKGARAEDISLALIGRNKANEAVTYLAQKVEDVQGLLTQGIVSQSEFDGLQLEYTLAQSDLALAQTNYEKALNGAEDEIVVAAKAQKELAQINVDAQLRLLEDATYRTKENMILIDQLVEVGELVPAGYPVAVLRSVEQKLLLGVSGKDLGQLHLEQEAVIETDRGLAKGKVIRIAEVPDEQHFLYEVEVSLFEQGYLIGEIVKCRLVISERPVIMIPIAAIMNDGIDYVYLETEGIVTLKKITIKSVDEGMAVVEGLEVDDQLIVSNLNRIHENSHVHLEE